MGEGEPHSSMELSYTPCSVRCLLIEMKNISQLMVDLAYSSVIFRDKDLAEEVLRLEERVDQLTYILTMNAVLAVRDKEDAIDVAGILKAATAIDGISNAAADIAIVELRGLGIHPLLLEAFESTEERLGKITVSPNSPFVGKSLSTLMLPQRYGVDVAAIRRGVEFIIDPSGSDVVKSGDILILRGDREGLEEVIDLCKGGESYEK